LHRNDLKLSAVKYSIVQMRYCIFIYGQFRSFVYNLENNLNSIYESILKNNDIDVFILTDKQGNYSADAEDMIGLIFEKYKCNVKFIKYWEDCTEYHNKEQINQDKYNRICKHNGGKHHFTSNMWYRRYVANELKNKYCVANNLTYDLHMFMRLFDITVQPNLPDLLIKSEIESCINSDKLLMSIDTIFIGKLEIIDKVFKFGENMDVYHDDIWNNIEYSNYFKQIDWGLYREQIKPTYSSEVQIFSHIFTNKFAFQSIRFDFNNETSPLNKNALFHVRLCNRRTFYA